MSFAKKTRTRTKVHCFCNKCNGALVDPRTRSKHTLRSINSNEAGPSGLLPDDDEMGDNEMEINYQEADEMDDNAMEYEPLPELLSEITGPLPERNYIFLTKKMLINESENSQLVKKGKISDRVLENLILDDADDDDQNRSSKDSGEEDDQNIDSDNSDEEVDFENDDYEEINFTSPEFDNDETKLPLNLNDDVCTWVMLWILQYQQRFKLSNVAINSLFKFLNLLLSTLDKNKFSSFPTSIYMAKKKMGIPKIFQFAACNKCHKLYDFNEIVKTTEIPSCSFVNYPNHSMQRFRQMCGNPLTRNIDSNNNPIFRPIMTFPLINIKQQLSLFFCRKDFEMSCRKWAERKNETEALFDIYDGRIWKEFKDGNTEPFFTKEYADSHIGLMLNMDWFQPFINSQYSVGVIYAVICNLPRAERFKPENILTLAVIPGPNEPKLHEINNYLFPIVNQLNKLWSGYNLITHEYNNGRFVRGAIIGCSSDVPATRKLCGFISARIACYRCYKSANFVNNQPNFGGFADFNEWFVDRDIKVIREKASQWKQCQTEEARKSHVSQHYVRWSEIYNLHYFNPVRHCVVDPMHCLFLGVAKWIVTKLWIGEGILNNEQLKTMQKRADAIKITGDIGRRPVRIATGEGFSNFTADMWRTFIMIFAIPITWDFLDDIDRKILAYFVRACKIITSRELRKNELNEAFGKLVEMNKLVEQKYGQEKISPNLHLCLHICECSLDYGPISSFWCFGFERMNGILGIYKLKFPICNSWIIPYISNKLV
jgi:hypothetical protein